MGSPSDEFLIHSDEVIKKGINNVINESATADLQERIIKSSDLPFLCTDYYKLSLDINNQKMYNKDNLYIKFRDIKDTNLKYIIKYLRYKEFK